MNLVLSYGDLAHSGGYRTRVLGELQALDRLTDPQQFLLVFDRNPTEFQKTFNLGVPYLVIPRSAALWRFFSTMRQITREQPIRLVHAHNLYSAALALLARKRYGYKVVLDYHGRIPEEYVFLGKGGGTSRRLLEWLEGWCVKRSDHVIVVSEKLSEYLIDRYHLPKRKLTVIPCCSDGASFNWDSRRRDAIREAMNFGDKFVCTHLGSFFEWYDPELLVNAFQQIAAETDAHLFVVTSDPGKAAGYLVNHLPADRFTVRSATHEEVPGLLNASDLGLLLLRPSPNIRTASPVKFAEYLNCGLPVLITEAVGDYSNIVTRENVGAVVGTNNMVDLATLHRIKAQRSLFATHCQDVGRQLTWETFAADWSRMLAQLQ